MFSFRKAGLATAALAIGATIATVAAASSSVPSRPTSNPFTVGCFDALDRNANTTIVSLLRNDGLSPEDVCVNEWLEYQGQAVTDPLITCVVPGGGTGVFPNTTGMNEEDACASIGAFVPEGGPVYGGLSGEQVRKLDQEIARRYEATWESSGPTCRDADVLRRVANEGIQALRAEDWTVIDHTTAGGKNCTHFRIDALGANVIVIDGDL